MTTIDSPVLTHDNAAAGSKGVQVTQRALAKIRSAMAKENVSPEQGGLRLGVSGGGCSGLSYQIRFDSKPRERDRVYEFEGVRVFVDPKSFIYLAGMVLDWEESLMKQGFNFINPNSSKSSSPIPKWWPISCSTVIRTCSMSSFSLSLASSTSS